jgi:hypothetical protein
MNWPFVSRPSSAMAAQSSGRSEPRPFLNYCILYQECAPCAPSNCTVFYLYECTVRRQKLQTGAGCGRTLLTFPEALVTSQSARRAASPASPDV